MSMDSVEVRVKVIVEIDAPIRARREGLASPGDAYHMHQECLVISPQKGQSDVVAAIEERVHVCTDHVIEALPADLQDKVDRSMRALARFHGLGDS